MISSPGIWARLLAPWRREPEEPPKPLKPRKPNAEDERRFAEHLREQAAWQNGPTSLPRQSKFRSDRTDSVRSDRLK
jgi:hypothetical protein